jgi:hypothetical protein
MAGRLGSAFCKLMSGALAARVPLGENRGLTCLPGNTWPAWLRCERLAVTDRHLCPLGK